MPDLPRWGAPAPRMLRFVALAAWLALVARLLSISLPGSRSGIESLIRRADTFSSTLSQLAVLVGGSQLVLFVASTLSERTLGVVHRILVVPAATLVLLLVMLSSTTSLEPGASVALGVASLLLACGSAGASLRSRVGRAHGLVLLFIALGAASRLGVRVMDLPAYPGSGRWPAVWLATAGHLFDALGVSLAAVRFVAERRSAAGAIVLVALALATMVAWGAMRGSYDDARFWQVLASRSIGDLAGSRGPVGPSSNHAVDAFALLFSGMVAVFPGRLSLGMTSAALCVMARPGVDVPASALVLALGALASPLCLSAERDPVSGSGRSASADAEMAGASARDSRGRSET